MARLRPATERILARLPGLRLLWILVWAALPWLNAGANLLLETQERSPVWEQRRVLVILNYAALSVAVAVTLWGAERLARRLEELDDGAGEPFREAKSVVGPLAAAAVTAIAFGTSTLVVDGWIAGVLRGATWFVVGIPLWTFLWTYGSLQLGLYRLGRRSLIPEERRSDPTLGLRPLGAAAFTGLWMLLAWLVPLVFTGLPDVVGIAIGGVVLGGSLTAFFFSLLGLHRQMIAVKKSEIATARRFYGEAYEPVREAPTLETLERQQSLLGAAAALESRAQAIDEWPISEGTLARVITIATSVVAAAVARVILDPLGL